MGRVAELEPIKGTPYLGQELLFGYQSDGNRPCHSSLNNPYYGVGVYTGMFKDRVMENMYAGFLFIDISIIELNKSSVNVLLALGLALNCNQFTIPGDPDFLENSSFANVYSHVALAYQYPLSKNLDLGFGFRFQHISNGGWQYPNPGYEMVSAQVSLSYLALDKTLEKPYVPMKKKDHEIATVVTVGVNGSTEDSEKKYFNTSFSTAYSVIRRPCYAFATGLDVTYNGSLIEESTNSETSTSDLIYYGAFISNELIFQKMRIGVQVGTHLYSSLDLGLPIYERIIMRYCFVPRSFLHFGIKLNGGKSESLEWGIGLLL